MGRAWGSVSTKGEARTSARARQVPLDVAPLDVEELWRRTASSRVVGFSCCGGAAGCGVFCGWGGWRRCYDRHRRC